VPSPRAKKTDEYQPDDIHNKEGSRRHSGGDGDCNLETKTKLSPSKKDQVAAGSKGKKSDLDQPIENQKQEQQAEPENAEGENDDGIEDVEEIEEYDDEGISDEVEEKKESADDKNETAEPNVESTESAAASTGPINEGTRKRKPRKD